MHESTMTRSIGAVNAMVPLPAIEPVATGGLAPPEGGPDEPEEGKDHRDDPEDMKRKTGAREDQHDEENEKEDHAGIVPFYPVAKRER